MSRDLGMCTATLLGDPMNADAAEIAAAADAAVGAGFREASVWAFQLDALAASDLRVRVLEAAMAWAGDDADAADAELDHYAALVERHGSTVVLAVTMEPSIRDVVVARRNLAALAARLAPLGAQVCVEFFAWSAIDSLRVAWDLVEPLGPDVGLVLDTFHWQRQPGGPDHALLSSIPGQRIGFVQIADAAAEPTGASETEAMTSRLLPGDGIVDFDRVCTVLDDIGADPFLTTEVFNARLVAERGALGAAAAARAATAAILR
jgi:sugar phosphate isomerase/epimerase